YIFYPIILRKGSKFTLPNIHNLPDCWDVHFRQGQVMPRRKCNYFTDPSFCFCYQKTFLVHFSFLRIFQQGGKVIHENKALLVIGIDTSIGSWISGAEITSWVIFRPIVSRQIFHLSLPRSLTAMGGNKDTFACQQVQTPVWNIIYSKIRHRLHLH